MGKYYYSFMVTKLKIGETWILFDWLNTRNVFIEDKDHPLYQSLENHNNKVFPFFINGSSDDFNYLVDNNFLVKDQETIREKVREQYNLAINPENLSVTFMPVDQACNFRCVYCYEDHSNSKYMDEEDLEIFTKYIINQKLSTLRIDYFGGEPLLNLQFIKQCNASMMKIGDKYGFSLTPSSMTTNGYLLTKKHF